QKEADGENHDNDDLKAEKDQSSRRLHGKYTLERNKGVRRTLCVAEPVIGRTHGSARGRNPSPPHAAADSPRQVLGAASSLTPQSSLQEVARKSASRQRVWRHGSPPAPHFARSVCRTKRGLSAVPEVR